MRDILPFSSMVNTVFYPIIELHNEFQALFIQGRHPIRSSIKICCIILSTCIGLFLFFNNPAIVDFFVGIIKATKIIPENLQYSAALLLNTLIFGSTGSYTSKQVIRAFCQYRFGDADYYLTSTRRKELVQNFKEQGFDLSEELIQEVVNFCITNFRTKIPHTEHIGVSTTDWEQILQDIIYTGSLERLLEQQYKILVQQEHFLKQKEAIEHLLGQTTTIPLETSKKLTSNCSFAEPYDMFPQKRFSICSAVSSNCPEQSTLSTFSVTTESSQNKRHRILAKKVLHKFQQHKKANQIQQLSQNVLPLDLIKTTTYTSPTLTM